MTSKGHTGVSSRILCISGLLFKSRIQSANPANLTNPCFFIKTYGISHVSSRLCPQRRVGRVLTHTGVLPSSALEGGGGTI
jgi:hypothetical protein